VTGELGCILRSRSAAIEEVALKNQIDAWGRLAIGQSVTSRTLRRCFAEHDAITYGGVYSTLERITSLTPELTRRSRLLERLEKFAPAWASAIKNRCEPHNKAQLPGNASAAWKWRQLHDELERRASVSINALQARIEHLNTELLSATIELIEKQTWGHQIRQTTSEQKAALGAYGTFRKKLTKSGTGVRDAEFIAAARREMATAKDAVPVWIMPLADVADTFDPRTTRFDVVIIDEASQCDPTALFALYLGKKVVVVGDDEQVTPLAVGTLGANVTELIKALLEDIPHKEVYDGETSIYELAQIAFGGVIRLTEHFRCAPSIIAFSNQLSYRGAIKPLREASSVPLKEHVVRYRVPDVPPSSDDINHKEAQHIASLICAAAEHPAYAKQEAGRNKPMTFGVVSLSGSQQSQEVARLLRLHMQPSDYHAREILCGDSANFQGDERDVMFLSLVDGPPESPPHSLRAHGAKNMFKKRFNVAASRARNQMWVVDSLNHETDLKMGDIRRSLIEHALDPNSWERELKRKLNEIDPRSEAFEGVVLKMLMERRYLVHPQYPAGAYFIDLVVEGGVDGGRKRLAIECDGERYHGPERLQHDIERQAILERLGWKFVRIRGSVFFRDQERAMAEVFRRLDELGIPPALDIETDPDSQPDLVTQEVIRRAAEIRLSWQADRDESSVAEATAPSRRGFRRSRVNSPTQ